MTTENKETRIRKEHIAAMGDTTIDILQIIDDITSLNNYRIQDLNDVHPMNDWRVKEAITSLERATSLIAHLV